MVSSIQSCCSSFSEPQDITVEMVGVDHIRVAIYSPAACRQAVQAIDERLEKLKPTIVIQTVEFGMQFLQFGSQFAQNYTPLLRAIQTLGQRGVSKVIISYLEMETREGCALKEFFGLSRELGPPTIPKIDRYLMACSKQLRQAGLPFGVSAHVASFLPESTPARLVFERCYFESTQEILLFMHLFPRSHIELRECQGMYGSHDAEEFLESYGNFSAYKCFWDVERLGTRLTRKTNIPYYFPYASKQSAQSQRALAHAPALDWTHQEAQAVQELFSWGVLDVSECGRRVLTTVNQPTASSTLW